MSNINVFETEAKLCEYFWCNNDDIPSITCNILIGRITIWEHTVVNLLLKKEKKDWKTCQNIITFQILNGVSTGK